MRDQTSQPAYLEFMNNYPSVREWLQRRPKNTQIGYCYALMKFCGFADVTPRDFQLMNRKEARACMNFKDVAFKNGRFLAAS